MAQCSCSVYIVCMRAAAQPASRAVYSVKLSRAQNAAVALILDHPAGRYIRRCIVAIFDGKICKLRHCDGWHRGQGSRAALAFDAFGSAVRASS